MFGMGWGELVVLAVVALFVLGPERLPGAIRSVTAVIAQGRTYLAAAKEQLDSEQFAELREPIEQLRAPLADLRAADPRRAVREFLTAEPPRRTTPTTATPTTSTPTTSTPATATSVPSTVTAPPADGADVARGA